MISISLTFFTSYCRDLFSMPNAGFISLLGCVTVFYLYQIGVRLFMFLPVFKFENPWLNTLKWISIPTYVVLLCAAALFNGNVYDEMHTFIRTYSSDGLQFLRVASWLLTVLAVLCIINIFNKNFISKGVKFFVLIKISAGAIVAISLISRSFNAPTLSIDYHSTDNTWLTATRQDLSEVRGKNIVISANPLYNTMLTSSDAGNFWVSFGPDAYNNSLKYNPVRRKVVDTFADGTLIEKQKAFQVLKKNKVDYYIATPSDIDKVIINEQEGFLKRYKPHSYLFQLR